jgi:hypothetical protein
MPWLCSQGGHLNQGSKVTERNIAVRRRSIANRRWPPLQHVWVKLPSKFQAIAPDVGHSFERFFFGLSSGYSASYDGDAVTIHIDRADEPILF